MACPGRAEGRHADLDRLIGLRGLDLPLSTAIGHALGDNEVIRVPAHVADDAQRWSDRLSRGVRRDMAERRQDNPKFRQKEDRMALMGTVGFWTPEYLEAKMKTVRLFRQTPILLVVARSLTQDIPERDPKCNRL